MSEKPHSRNPRLFQDDPEILLARCFMAKVGSPSKNVVYRKLFVGVCVGLEFSGHGTGVETKIYQLKAFCQTQL